MTVNRRKKDTRMRGSHTHGWGSKKKHRGSGNRGGKGRAGTGKRSDAVKPSIWKEEYFGKHGFVSKNRAVREGVNIEYLDSNAQKLVDKKAAKIENGAVVINLAELGFDKLLGKGRVTKKLIITAGFASAGAVESVKAAGGDVIVQKAGPAKAGAAGAKK